MAGDIGHNQYIAAKEISKFVNVENAKKFAFLLMIGFSLYHGYIMVKLGGNSCKWLLSDGHFQGNNYWQPYGCMVHHYSPRDAEMCVQYISYWGGETRLLFAGDFRLKQLYHRFVRHYKAYDNHDIYPVMETKERKKKTAFSDEKSKLYVDFRFTPALNSEFYKLAQSWAEGTETPPTVLVLSSGLLTMQLYNGSRNGLKVFKKNLTKLSTQLMVLKNTRIIWMMQDPVMEDFIRKNLSMITNKHIDAYNEAAAHILSPLGFEVWSSNRLIAQAIGFLEKNPDGLHVSDVALDWDVQILLNLHCNNHIKFYDGTCCSIAEPISVTQILTFSFFGVCFVTTFLCFIFDTCCIRRDAGKGSRRPKPFIATHHRVGSDISPDENSFFLTVYELSTALAKLGAILGYFFVCDRTIFFMKENKSFTVISFLLPLTYVFVVGIFFTEYSQQTGTLHRDLTDEWKGWMQLVILVYHITGASKVLPVYMHIRVLVSAYLFLSGYGHFTYFWCRGDRGLARFFRVLFRMNLLVIGLCFVMNRPYQFYYFVPLVSFWYIVAYITMAIWPQVSSDSVESKRINCLWMVVKFIVLIVLVTLLYASEYVFDKVFLTNPLKALFVSSDDQPHEWRFRWELDRYSTIFGMLFAFLYQSAKQNRFLQDNHQMNLFSGPVSALMTFVGVGGIIGYTAFTIFCHSKPECNAVHSYITVLPILGYVLLRNCIGSVRQKYSTFFAWFGRISLEMFIGQYHIWLAADTHGVLVLIPGNPVINLLITSFIFVCVAHEIHSLTCILLPYAVPDDWRKLTRNSLIAMAVLLPIAISHGVFAL